VRQCVQSLNEQSSYSPSEVGAADRGSSSKPGLLRDPNPPEPISGDNVDLRKTRRRCSPGRRLSGPNAPHEPRGEATSSCSPLAASAPFVRQHRSGDRGGCATYPGTTRPARSVPRYVAELIARTGATSETPAPCAKAAGTSRDSSASARPARGRQRARAAPMATANGTRARR